MPALPTKMRMTTPSENAWPVPKHRLLMESRCQPVCIQILPCLQAIDRFRSYSASCEGKLLLTAWKQRCEAKWPSCPWICHREGVRLEGLKHSWRKACEAETDDLVWNSPILLPHDFLRTAVRNMVRAGSLKRSRWRYQDPRPHPFV